MFKRKKSQIRPVDQAGLAEVALKNIHDGVLITDFSGVVELINPAAVTMTGLESEDQALGLDYGLLLHLLTKDAQEMADIENPLTRAMRSNQPLDKFQGCLRVGNTDRTLPVALSMIPADDGSRIITFRDITQELEEEGEQSEFISTASHEMRTPVATIDGYLMLCLNPQTATVDERARGYLTAAEKASKHLGKLFQDLLDVTRLDDGRIRPHLTPVDLTGLIRAIAADHAEHAAGEDLHYNIGTAEASDLTVTRKLDQIVYGFVDKDFIREIMDNLIENAIKYTPAGGSIYINVRGDGDRALINVTDTGVGISSEDLTHIFQKFYRVDNSDTRTIGGTGLGLYMVKQRVEAIGGKVWAESAFGEGSTFYVSLPRLSADEYEKRMIVVRNEEIQEQLKAQQDQAALAAYVAQNPVPGTAGSVVAPFVNNSGIDLPIPVAPIITPGGGGVVVGAGAIAGGAAGASSSAGVAADIAGAGADAAAGITVAAGTTPPATETPEVSAEPAPPAPEVPEVSAEPAPPAPETIVLPAAEATELVIPAPAADGTGPVWTVASADASAPPTIEATPGLSPDAPPGAPPEAPPETPPPIIITTPTTVLTNNLNGENK